MNGIYRDLSLTIGIMIGGEGVLIPAIYFSFFDFISLRKLIVIALIANLVADTAWYLIGRYVPLERMKETSFLKKYEEQIEKAGEIFRKNSLYLLFISKFVVGTRTVMQILCGLNKVNIVKYLIVNLAGILAYTLSLYGVALMFRESLKQFKMGVATFELLFAFIFILTVVASIWYSKKIKQKWFQ